MKIYFGPSDKKKKSTSKQVVTFVIMAIFTFTGIAIWLQYKIGMELSPTLITCFYGFCVGELWCLASIKKSKVSNGYTHEEEKVQNDDIE